MRKESEGVKVTLLPGEKKETVGFGLMLNEHQRREVLAKWNKIMVERGKGNGNQPLENMQRYCWFTIIPFRKHPDAVCFQPLLNDYTVDNLETENDISIFIPADKPREEYKDNGEIIREMCSKVSAYVPKSYNIARHIGDVYVLEQMDLSYGYGGLIRRAS